MLWQTFRRRSSRARYLRSVFIVSVIIIILDLLSLAWNFSSQSCVPEVLDKKTSQKAIPKIFVASTHWNNEKALRTFWNKAVLDLVKHVGPDNIFISIYESGSWDDSKGALRLLDLDLERLGVQRTIVLDETTHADELAKSPADTGWVETPRGKKEPRRISYLAGLRNESLKPLIDLALNGVRYDKILFLNDVAFMVYVHASYTGRHANTILQPEDVMTLIGTRNGEYAAACSMDFMHPPHYYDTFVLRDSGGHEAITSTFPYFRSSTSRNAMIAGHPVSVQSCWNGIVVFSAIPFYSSLSPLRFRSTPDTLATHHLEASECCLIHYDNPLTPNLGVWVNPLVRVGYSLDAYHSVHPSLGISRRGSEGGNEGCWPSTQEKIWGIWRNRVWRWFWVWGGGRGKVKGRLRTWQSGGDGGAMRDEAGQACLVDEMQVLVANGWAHV